MGLESFLIFFLFAALECLYVEFEYEAELVSVFLVLVWGYLIIFFFLDA
jgi:hypothetical protein